MGCREAFSMKDVPANTISRTFFDGLVARFVYAVRIDRTRQFTAAHFRNLILSFLELQFFIALFTIRSQK